MYILNTAAEIIGGSKRGAREVPLPRTHGPISCSFWQFLLYNLGNPGSTTGNYCHILHLNAESWLRFLIQISQLPHCRKNLSCGKFTKACNMLYRYFHFYVTIYCPLGKGNHPHKSYNSGLKGTTKQILCVPDNVLNCCCDLCSILVLCHTVNCGRIIPSGTLFLIQLTSWNRLPDWCSWTQF